MVVAIFDSSKQIIERLVDMIAETEKDILFYNASSYNSAMDILKEYKPDAVILDWQLCANKGPGIVNEAGKVNDKAVVIILAGYIDPYIKEQCEKLENKYLLDKYYDFEKIPAIIKAIRLNNK